MTTSALDSPTNYRCLLVSTAGNIGGMERIVCGLSRGLQAYDWPVRTVFPEVSSNSGLSAWCDKQGIQVELSPDVADAAQSHGFRTVMALRRLTRESNAPVVNLHYGSNFISLKDVIAVRALSNTRCVATVHQAVDWAELGARKLKMTRAASRVCDAIVAITRATEDLLLEAGVSPEKIRLIHCGVPTPVYSPSQHEARMRLGLPDDAFVVACLAHLVPRKGIAKLIEAVGATLQSPGNTILVIGGDGPERQRLEEKAERLPVGSVRFLGTVSDDTSSFYAAADIFALPSYFEGLPLVFLEAALHGIPSIATAVGGVPEAIVDGETGVLITPGDVSALSDAINRLRESPELRSRMGEAARTHAQEHFSEQNMTEQYLALFSEISPAVRQRNWAPTVSNKSA